MLHIIDNTSSSIVLFSLVVMIHPREMEVAETEYTYKLRSIYAPVECYLYMKGLWEDLGLSILFSSSSSSSTSFFPFLVAFDITIKIAFLYFLFHFHTAQS